MDFLDDHALQLHFASFRPKNNTEGERRLTFRMRLGVTSTTPGLTHSMTASILAMESDESMGGVSLLETVPSRNLAFKASPGARGIKQKLTAIDLTGFELSREGDPASIYLYFEFNAPWNDVDFSWLKEAYGFDQTVTVEECQQGLLGAEKSA